MVTLTLTFRLIQARDQTRLPCEFGANPFSGSQDISYTNKTLQTDGAKNRTWRSSLHALKHNYDLECRLQSDSSWLFLSSCSFWDEMLLERMHSYCLRLALIIHHPSDYNRVFLFNVYFVMKQIYNFLRFCELLVITCTQLKTIHLTTGFDDVRYNVYIWHYIFQLIFGS